LDEDIFVKVSVLSIEISIFGVALRVDRIFVVLSSSFVLVSSSGNDRFRLRVLVEGAICSRVEEDTCFGDAFGNKSNEREGVEGVGLFGVIEPFVSRRDGDRKIVELLSITVMVAWESETVDTVSSMIGEVVFVFFSPVRRDDRLILII